MAFETKTFFLYTQGKVRQLQMSPKDSQELLKKALEQPWDDDFVLRMPAQLPGHTYDYLLIIKNLARKSSGKC